MKQFFKLTWKKVIATIIITIIFLISFGTTGGTGSGPFIGSSILSVLSIFLMFLPIAIIGFLQELLKNDLILQPLFLILELIYLYFISCLIIVFWNDNKNRLNNYWRKRTLNKLYIIGIIIIIVIIMIFSIYRDIQKVEKYAGPAPDARREGNIREISLAMENQYDVDNKYPEILIDNEGRIINKNIGSYLNPIPNDPGGGEVKGCNDKKGVPYRGFSNTSNRYQYCIYACLLDGKFFAASEKGTKTLDKAPTNSDCW